MHRTAVVVFVIGILVLACSPVPSPVPTTVTTPSPSVAALACDHAAQQLTAARAQLLADIAAPPTGVDPGFGRSPIPEHVALGVRVLRDNEACFSPGTTAAWQAANALLYNPPQGGIGPDTLRGMFDALPTEAVG